MSYLDRLNRHHRHLGWLSVVASLLEAGPLGKKALGRGLFDIATRDSAQATWFATANLTVSPDDEVSFASAQHIVDMAEIYGVYDSRSESLTDLGLVLLAVEPWRPGSEGTPFLWEGTKRYVGLYLLLRAYGDAIVYIFRTWPRDYYYAEHRFNTKLDIFFRANKTKEKEESFNDFSRVSSQNSWNVLWSYGLPLMLPLCDLGYADFLGPPSDSFRLLERGKRLALTIYQNQGSILSLLSEDLPEAFVYTEGISRSTPAHADALLATCADLPPGLRRPEVAFEAVALLAQVRLLEQDPEHFLSLRRAIELMPEVTRASGGRFFLLESETSDDPVRVILKRDIQNADHQHSDINRASKQAPNAEPPAPEPAITPEEPIGAHAPEDSSHASAEVEDNLEGDSADARATKPPNWLVQIIKAERSIFELHRRWTTGTLILKPDFQRDFVWDLPKQVKLVESVLARIPLPVVYLSDESEEETLVIDGQQRLTTLFRYMDNQFALRNLRLLPHLNGKRFRDLDARLQRRFEDTPLTAYVIQPGSNPEIKFEVFERLNQGAVDLNAQEIRNSLFRGAGLETIKDLARPGGTFRTVAGPHRSFARMKADELVLRAVAFIDRGQQQYRGDMKQFLNEELQRLNQMSDEERTSVLERFERSLVATARVFGDKAFRRYQPRTKVAYSPELNAALMDVVVWGFSQYDHPPDFWALRSAEVVSMAERLQQSSDFREAITYGTGDTSRVETRFRLWQNGLHDVLRDHP